MSVHCLDLGCVWRPVTSPAVWVPHRGSRCSGLTGALVPKPCGPLHPTWGPPGPSEDLLVYFVVVPGEAPGVSLGTGYSRAPRAL